MELTGRQAMILRAVVEVHHATGRPVGSRTLVDRGAIVASSSTVRSEFARLEELGLLKHPHTSAGRVPTDRGYRIYVDRLLDRSELPLPHQLRRDIVPSSRRIEEALQETSRALSEVTRMLAVVTAPPHRGAVIRRVEVVQLSANRLVVVCITDTGDVTRHVVQTRDSIDPGLVEWAGDFLNEQVTGMSLGQNVLARRLEHPALSRRERSMLALLAPVFTELVVGAADVHIGGSQALAQRLGADVRQVMALVTMLDERRRLLEALQALSPRHLGSEAHGVSIRIGAENDIPELQSLSLVGTSYGLPARPLGVVGLIGPVSLDYPMAIAAVSAAAEVLNDLTHDLYAS